ncbi:MAG TPA: 6-bladed beta-propeller [Longimicrobiales bacterium]|nr:6-bladed beta-propeller [Longimicrobiales bacterium]
MRRAAQLALVAVGLAAASALQAQTRAPEIPFQAVDALGGFPDDIHLGEVAGVARNSRNEIFVYTRTGNPNLALGLARYISRGGSRLFKFDSRGRYEREMGQGIYGALFAQQVRVSADDNIWIVDRMSGQVIRFDPQGRIQMVLSRKPEAMQVPAGGGGGGRGGRGFTEGESFQQPADVAWDSQGNIYVADGLTRSRIAKYEPSGRFITNFGGDGDGPGQFSRIHGLQIDARDNLYVADYDNRRIQVLDSNGRFIREITGVGAPMAICITPGPSQVLYVSNSNPPDDLEVGGEIYKLRLDGTIIGRFGTVGKRMGQFGTVNAIDCRSENDLLVGEIGNWRVQRVTLRATE